MHIVYIKPQLLSRKDLMQSVVQTQWTLINGFCPYLDENESPAVEFGKETERENDEASH